jgi:hypothetical protein
LLAALLVTIGSAAAQSVDPITGAPVTDSVLPSLSEIIHSLPQARQPFTGFSCAPGQVLNAAGESCLPGVAVPPTDPSLQSSVPDLLPKARPVLPLFVDGSHCQFGQILQPNGEPCGG